MSYFAIMDLIESHPFLTAIITVGAAELISVAFKHFRQKQQAQIRKVHEVLMFNELGEKCAGKHWNSSATADTYICRNPYCALKNVSRMAEQIDQAQYSIDLAIYTFTSLTLSEAFKRALQRGVVIRIVSDQEMVYSSGSQILHLASFDVPVRGPTVKALMMHHKFCVIDGEARVKEIMELKGRKSTSDYCSVVITGSVNWTRQGIGGNWENCIISSDKVLTESFQAEFHRMWKAFEMAADKYI